MRDKILFFILGAVSLTFLTLVINHFDNEAIGDLHLPANPTFDTITVKGLVVTEAINVKGAKSSIVLTNSENGVALLMLMSEDLAISLRNSATQSDIRLSNRIGDQIFEDIAIVNEKNALGITKPFIMVKEP